MTTLLVMFACAVSIGAGSAMAYSSFEVNPRLFVDFSAVTPGDAITGLVKALSFGGAIPIVAGYCGLTTHGGSEGVGSATTRARSVLRLNSRGSTR